MPKISAANLEEHRAGTTERLLDAWGELVLERGYDAVSLADVAAQAGLARTAIYNYFPDRESLLFAWTDREVQRTAVALEEELAQQGSATDKLRTFVRVELESFVTSHLPPGREIVHILGPKTFQRFMEHLAPVEAMLRSILEEGIASREFADADPEEVLPLVIATIGAERGPLSTGEHKIDEAATRVNSFLLRALGASR